MFYSQTETSPAPAPASPPKQTQPLPRAFRTCNENQVSPGDLSARHSSLGSLPGDREEECYDNKAHRTPTAPGVPPQSHQPLLSQETASYTAPRSQSIRIPSLSTGRYTKMDTRLCFPLMSLTQLHQSEGAFGICSHLAEEGPSLPPVPHFSSWSLTELILSVRF